MTDNGKMRIQTSLEPQVQFKTAAGCTPLGRRGTVIRPQCPLAEVPTAAKNWMAQVGFGSFADVGRSLSNDTSLSSPRLYLALEVGEACQLHCRHCIYHRSQPPLTQPLPLVRDRLFAALDRGFDPLWVTYSGKEPTVFPDQLTEMARRTKCPNRPNILMTNGLELAGDLLSDLGDAISLFDISIDGDEEAHDWMRGPGAFRRTWRNIEEVLRKTEASVGIIATAVHATIGNDRPQIQDLITLAGRLRRAFGVGDRISLTVSIYYGPPDDPLLLDADEIAELMLGLDRQGFPVRVLFTGNCAHQWPRVQDRIGWKHMRIHYDAVTGFPLIRCGSVTAILFNLTTVSQMGLRISNEGLAFIGCNHLVLGDNAREFSIGDLRDEELDEIAGRVLRARTSLMERLHFAPQCCVLCRHWDGCRGGDRLSGLYYVDHPMDPYCGFLRQEVVA